MKPIAQQTILITGATDGLGKSTAHALAAQGATLLLHGRNQQKLEKTQQEIHEATGNARLALYRADFAILEEVRQMGKAILADYPRLDILINNAGIGAGKMVFPRRELSKDGYELRFAVNYLAPFLLTHLLLPALREGAPSRIINVSSIGQEPIDFNDVMLEQRYSPMRAYRQSKLAQIMFTIDLADRLKGEQISVNSLHPASLMNTKMVYESIPYTMSTIEDGLKTVMYVSTSPHLDGVTGRYFEQLQDTHANPQAYDEGARRKLWQLSERLTGTKLL